MSKRLDDLIYVYKGRIIAVPEQNLLTKRV